MSQAKIKAAFKAMPHVNQVWVSRDGHYHLTDTKGCRVVTRKDAEEFPDEEEKSEPKPEDQNERVERERMIEFLQAQNKELADKCNSANERNEKSMMEYKELEDNNKTLQESMAESEKEIVELKAANDELSKEISAQKEQNKNLSEQNEALAKEVDALKNKKDAES